MSELYGDSAMYAEIERLEKANALLSETLRIVGKTENCGDRMENYRQCLTKRCCSCCWETAQLANEVLAELACKS